MTHVSTGIDRGRTVARGSVVATLAALLAMVALVLTGGPASAHDTIIGSDPDDGSIHENSPTEAVLTFSSDVTPTGAVALLRSPDGTENDLADPEYDGRDVIWELAGVQDGANELVWSVISSDGHRIDGTIGFTVAAADRTGEAELDEPGAPDAPSGEDISGEEASTEGADVATDDAGDVGDTGADETGDSDTDEQDTADADEPAAAEDDSWLPGGRSTAIIGAIALALAAAAAIWLVVVRRRPTDGPTHKDGPTHHS